jgi:hypothetical protein
MKVETSDLVGVPPEQAYDIYADYAGWPHVFPTISAVHLLRHTGNSVVLEVDHRTAGKVSNELLLQPKRQLELRESKRRYDARFVNRFESVPEGSRITVTGDIRLKGLARFLAPFLGWYARRLIERFTLQPIKVAAEGQSQSLGEKSNRDLSNRRQPARTSQSRFWLGACDVVVVEVRTSRWSISRPRPRHGPWRWPPRRSRTQ